MNNKIAFTGCLVLIGCVIVIAVLFRGDAADTGMPRTDDITPAADPDIMTFEEPEPDREPVVVDEPPPAESGPEEPEPPGVIRSQEPGWWIWGLVRQPDYAPVADAWVAIELETSSMDRYSKWRLETVRSDAQGRYAIRFDNPFRSPGLAPEGKMPFKLYGRTFAPGYIQPYYHDDEVLIDASQEHFAHRSDFLLIEGCFVHGIVQTPGGAPAVDAEVMLCVPDTGQKRATAFTDGNGEYFMIIDCRSSRNPVEPGRYALVAALMGIGVSQPISIDIEAGKSVEAPLLALQACGTIEGTIERPDGTPVEGVEICAFPQSWSEESENGLGSYSTGFPGHKRAGFDLATIGTGHTFGLASSGADGRFRVSGLRPGAYVLEVSWSFQSRESEDIDPDDIHIKCETGDTGVRIVICNYELRVLLLDEQGRRIPRAKLHCTSGPFQSGRGDEVVGGEAVLNIAPGPLRLQATTVDGRIARHESTVAAGSYRNEVHLNLREADLGRLCLLITYHDGRPLPREAPLDMVVDSENDFLHFDEYAFHWDDRGRAVVELVPDRYELTLTVKHRDWWRYPQKMARYVTVKDVIIEEGRETELPVTLGPAGALRFTLHCDGSAPYPWDIALKVIPVDGESKVPRLLNAFAESEKHGRKFSHALRPGIAYFSRNPLAPGDYIIEIEAAGFANAKDTFTIRNCEVTDVEIWLPAER